MSQKKERKAGVPFADSGIDDADIGDYSEKAVPVRTVPQEPPPAGIIHGAVRGPAVSPLIRRPYLKTPAAEFSGQARITEGMFRHTMNYMYHRQRSPRRRPAPQKELYPVIGFQPFARFIHRSDCTLMSSFWQ